MILKKIWKVQAIRLKLGAKAVVNKIKNTNRDLGTDYEIEKIKENTD